MTTAANTTAFVLKSKMTIPGWRRVTIYLKGITETNVGPLADYTRNVNEAAKYPSETCATAIAATLLTKWTPAAC